MHYITVNCSPNLMRRPLRGVTFVLVFILSSRVHLILSEQEGEFSEIFMNSLLTSVNVCVRLPIGKLQVIRFYHNFTLYIYIGKFRKNEGK